MTGAHTGDYFWGILFGGSTGKSCNSPGGYYMKKCLPNYFGNHCAVEGMVILIHYGGGTKIRRWQNNTAGSLKHLVFLGKIHRRSPLR